MTRLRYVLFALFWLAVVSLTSYEVVQKSPATPLGALPGAELADRADRAVNWDPATGITPVDALVHESREACVYYRSLATGRMH